MALTQKSPFLALKTHGLLVDEAGQKMAKSNPESNIDPDDLLFGSEKLDGSRSFGYGPDVLRLWAASNDTDVNIEL